MLRLALCSVLLSFAAACGGSSSAPAATPATTPAPPAGEPAAAPAPARTIGPDECCCPFASAEDVQFNVMTKADCDAAGTGCVEDARCLGE